MILNITWFILIAILYIGFFILEGFDFGVGILLPFLGKEDTERRAIINTIGPHWDGNEVWLLTAGGATFAAFPHWYATLFSGFYLPFFLLLVALIIRGVSFEFRSLDEKPLWRSLWDWAICLSSLVASLLLGVAFANLARGIPIDANMQYTGGFFNLLNWYGLLGGITVILVFSLHGAIFLCMKTDGNLVERAGRATGKLWLPATIAVFLLVIGTYLSTDILKHAGAAGIAMTILTALAILLTGYYLLRGQDSKAFLMTTLTILALIATVFIIMFPRVIISSLNPEWSLTILNAASSSGTLHTMTIVAVIFVPIILIYQGWSYYIFRKRVTTKTEELVY
jgi:cytochrome d ubiquinol oxidase subunit II